MREETTNRLARVHLSPDQSEVLHNTEEALADVRLPVRLIHASATRSRLSALSLAGAPAGEQRQQGYTAEEAVSRLAEGKGRASGRMGRGPGLATKAERQLQ